mgnify:FL=1
MEKGGSPINFNLLSKGGAMRKLFVVMVVVTLFASGVAFAASPAQENTGCGLGAELIGPGGNDSLLGQLAMTLLNGTSGNQTFRITSGTSQCKAPSKIVRNEELKEFVVANLDTLSKNISMGNGESLDTFAELIGIANENRQAVYTKLQANFSNIFTSDKIEAADVVDNIVSVINS